MTLSTSLVAVWYSSDSCRSRSALPQFGQQPRVLHRDDRLRRKVLHQRDLLVGERHELPCGPDTNDAEQLAILAQRHRETGSYVPEIDDRTAEWVSGS